MPRSTNNPPATTSLDVRDYLVRALRLDLVGPWPAHELAEERLPGWVRPSNWYLSGFLIPSESPPQHTADEDEDDDVSEVPEKAGLAEENNEDHKSAKKGFFPSSIGLSFLISMGVEALKVTVCWGDYTPDEVVGDDGQATSIWQRTPRKEIVGIALQGNARDPAVVAVPDSDGMELHVVERPIPVEDLRNQIPEGTRSVSIFLVNNRTPNEGKPDKAFAFQSELEVQGGRPFVPRPDLRGANDEDWDEQVAELHYADTPGYATGHGVSAEWQTVDGACYLLRTTWIPAAEVEKTETRDVPSVELSMEALGSLADGKAAQTALLPLVDQYRAWINQQRDRMTGWSAPRCETAGQLLWLAERAADRLQGGVEVLAKDADALDAFRVANRAVGRALRQRLAEIQSPRWKAFQLAFVLMNLPGLADPKDPHRETVDLLFFPTGGGKTEAYLGLAAFTMVLRRLQHRESDRGLGGAGVSVVMRYTLRLLTLDQLGRAAGLVCALELERIQDPGRYGPWPFEIGLWVGKAATPNVLGYKGFKGSDSARSKVKQFKSDPRNKPSPIPLENCPWCGTRFAPESFTLLPNDDRPKELRIVCVNFECEFSGDRALPIVAVDEPLYRRLPAFLIATVDKFASLPWIGPSGALLGGADRYDSSGFYGAADPRKGQSRLEAPLPPPDLIIQDELHLISGPLGTMAGLYETVIEALCIREVDGRIIRPKIVASTATARRANDQIQALFGRPVTQVFPPPGPDRRDSFFAQTMPTGDVPGRLYLGVAAQGRNPKVVLQKTWLAIMGAAERAYRDAGGHKNTDNPADPYMTVLGYFNSLRELGGCRRILEEQIQNTLKGYGRRKRVGEKTSLFRDRKTFSEVVELTSRVSTDKVAEARRRLDQGFHDRQRIDCAIATNMISVGLDIPRLGLMVVMGQPKTHSEYIQATSRVGRDDKRPGLVVTLLNIHKPRDRSHYERFRHYHETFYRAVEVSSVTPFSARALDRGFSGALVAMARHCNPVLTPASGVEKIVDERMAIEQRLLNAFLERVRQQPILDSNELEERLRNVQLRIGDLLDSWCKVFEDYATEGVHLQYQKYESDGAKPLLREMLDRDFESPHHRKFRANRSLRDVEPEVNLFVKDLTSIPLDADQ